MTAKTILEQTSHIILDLKGTLMFQHDRFMAEEPAAVYHTLGFARLSSATVNEAIRRTYASLPRLLNEPGRADSFPSLRQRLQALPFVPERAVDELVSVYTALERGRIDDDHAETVRKMSLSHTLHLYADIWSPRPFWDIEIRRHGLEQHLATVLYTSDTNRTKPSRALLQALLNKTGARQASAVCVIGDSPMEDLEPARSLGMRTIYVDAKMRAHPAAEATVASLAALMRNDQE